jgi:DNA-binding MarR family transcriptional regulator
MSTPNSFATALQGWIDVYVRRSMRNLMLYAKGSGLPVSQLGALFHISKGNCGVSDVGDDLGISSAAASQMLERMVQQGLVSRTEDPCDRRVKQIVLTAKGEQVLQGSLQAGKGWLDELAASLSPAEQEQVAAALTIMIAKADRLEQQHDP